MKKITFLIAALLIGATSMVAQNVVIDRPDNLTNSIIATQGNDGTGVYCADQFELTGDTAIGAIQIFGTNSGGTDLGAVLLGLNIFIYADESGLPAGDPTLPGTGIVELADIDLANVIVNEDGAGNSNFTVNVTSANGGTEITLPAGTYWLAAFPSVDNAPAGTPGRWNWGLSDALPAVEPVLIDPFDLFGAGILTWSNIAGLIGDTATGMAWTLFDGEILSVGDNTIEGLRVGPNPTSDILNITTNGSVRVSEVSLYDITGKLIMTQEEGGILDISRMNTGVYFAEISADNGSTQTVKVIKN